MASIEDYEKLNELANNLSAFSVQPQTLSALSVRDYKMADYQYEVIMKQIKDFEDELDDEHEIAIQLASFGKDILLNVTDIGFSNPNTLVFYGLVNGQNASLIQHMSMLSFLLLAVKKQEPTKPARRIGFMINEDEAE